MPASTCSALKPGSPASATERTLSWTTVAARASSARGDTGAEGNLLTELERLLGVLLDDRRNS